MPASTAAAAPRRDASTGNEARNRLEGGGGRDRSTATAAPTASTAAPAATSLTGGRGADIFRFASASEADGDRILDFGVGADRIDLSAIDADTAAPATRASTSSPARPSPAAPASSPSTPPASRRPRRRRHRRLRHPPRPRRRPRPRRPDPLTPQSRAARPTGIAATTSSPRAGAAASVEQHIAESASAGHRARLMRLRRPPRPL